MGQKRVPVPSPLQVELLAIVSHPIQVLGANMGLLGEQRVLLTTQPSLQPGSVQFLEPVASTGLLV